jgi:sulfur carrier protein ThiS
LPCADSERMQTTLEGRPPVASTQHVSMVALNISMKIKIRPIGLIKRFAEDGEIEAEAGLTPRKLIADLGIPAELKMVSFVNGSRMDLDYELLDGDEVKLVTLLTGG